jgi:hypothetical protein
LVSNVAVDQIDAPDLVLAVEYVIVLVLPLAALARGVGTATDELRGSMNDRAVGILFLSSA